MTAPVGAACACGIDTHAHVAPPELPRHFGVDTPADWPSLVTANACHRTLIVAGQGVQTLSPDFWNVSGRLAAMPGMGLGLQVVSPLPELLAYWLPARAAQQLLRYLNDHVASVVAASGGRLMGFGAVPLQDIDLAIRELRYVVEVLGLRGVEIGSNIDGLPVGARKFDPFFEACEALGASVFVHAIRPVGQERLVGPASLMRVLAYPGEIGLAAASVITSNLMVRYPRLRMSFSHGGGTLAALLPRLQKGWEVFPGLQEQMAMAPLQQARRLYYDTLVFDEALLRHLVQTFGETQMLIGTDHPFDFQEREPVRRIREAGLGAVVEDLLVGANAARFLGIDPLPPSATR